MIKDESGDLLTLAWSTQSSIWELCDLMRRWTGNLSKPTLDSKINFTDSWMVASWELVERGSGTMRLPCFKKSEEKQGEKMLTVVGKNRRGSFHTVSTKYTRISTTEHHAKPVHIHNPVVLKKISAKDWSWFLRHWTHLMLARRMQVEWSNLYYNTTLPVLHWFTMWPHPHYKNSGWISWTELKQSKRKIRTMNIAFNCGMWT